MKRILNTVVLTICIMLIATAVFAIGYAFKITPSGMMQEDLVLLLQNTQTNDETACYNSGALAAATEAVSIAAAVNYAKNGVFGQIATGTIAVSGATQEVSTTKLYAFSYNTTTSTTEVTLGTVGETDIKNIVLPTGNVPFGYVKVVTDATHQFVPGTTSFAGTGITSTFYNIAFQPSKVRVQLTEN